MTCSSGLCKKNNLNSKETKKIPRIIHQIYLGYTGPMPEEWKKNHQVWKDYADKEGWEVKLWNMEDCENLINDSLYPKFLEVFQNYPYGVQKADSIRYFILFKYGGIYSDLDVVPKYSIEPMLQMYDQSSHLKAMFCQSPQDRTVSNWFMVARPECQLFLQMIRGMEERRDKTRLNKHFTVLWSTGPIMVKNMIEKYEHPEEVYIFPRELLTTCTFCKDDCNSFALLINDQSGTWNGGATQYLNTLTCAMEPVKNLTWLAWLIIVSVLFGVMVVGFIVLYYMYFKCTELCMR